MPTIEITLVIRDEDETVSAKEIEKRRKDKELLEKIEKYGMFNDKGEWVQ